MRNLPSQHSHILCSYIIIIIIISLYTYKVREIVGIRVYMSLCSVNVDLFNLHQS